MKFNIANSIKRSRMSIEKYSPEILMAAGLVGFGFTLVSVCKATIKAQDLLNNHKETVEHIHEVMESEEYEQAREEGEYTEETFRRDLTIATVQTGVKIVKTYAPAMILGIGSAACVLGSHHILRTRNIALAAAYATIDSAFGNYRKRVIDKFGEEIDKEFKYGIKAVEIEETVTDEKGKEKTVKKTVEMVEKPSEYAKFFDASCKGWDKNPEYNLTYLRGVEAHFTNKLKYGREGRVFLNDVYDYLGIDRTKAGQIIGWVYDPENPDKEIDFGLYKTNRANQAFVNGYEPVVLLDFNVDGEIWTEM